jgi:hypothetical protein
LLAKQTPRNVNLGNVRFSIFNKERDIPLAEAILPGCLRQRFSACRFQGATLPREHNIDALADAVMEMARFVA